MRIARPILMVSTPLGVVLGLRAAWNVRPVLAVLMALLMTVVGCGYWYTLRILRKESAKRP